MTRVYEEIVDFISGGTTATTVAAWEPSPNTKARVAQLIEMEKSGAISAAEKADLNHYMELEHLMRLAKARAHERLMNG